MAEMAKVAKKMILHYLHFDERKCKKCKTKKYMTGLTVWGETVKKVKTVITKFIYRQSGIFGRL